MNGARRNGYIYNRVLIEASRVLDTQFNDAVVFLTGAQLEMLRNVSQYLSRRDTYVTEYKSGYYIAPSDEDYDTILGIVADMEEALMGNPNTIWGYNDVLRDIVVDEDVPAGDVNIDGAVCPEGQLWRVLDMSCKTDSASCTKMELFARIDAAYIPLREVLNPDANKLYPFAIDIVLREGSKIYCVFDDMTLDDEAQIAYTGYRMEV